MDVDAAKRRAGEAAADAIGDGQVVGLGTGSTAAYAIRRLGERVDVGLSVRGVPTSHAARELAIDAGVPLTGLDVDAVDVAIDGADLVAGTDLLKGGGAAHAREKVVAAAADRLVIVVDPRKLADVLDRAVPVEALPDARPVVTDRLTAVGADIAVREGTGKDGPVVTDNGNVVLDCAFGRIDAPADLAERIDGTPGVVAHGLFPDAADEVIVGTEDGVRRPVSERG
ncbi:ribose 5-phosphate isomerase A [Halobacteriales archaeon SW_7_68_16]|nr:MAG: ribose 5-phosphate isomerase A [Halobacteriales archaeon SW_7_68_16]